MKKIIILVLGVYALVSCKKDTSTTGGWTDTISPSSATSYYAVLTVERIQSLSPTSTPSIQTSYDAYAYFSSSPRITINTINEIIIDSLTPLVAVDTIKINNVPLEFFSIISEYRNVNLITSLTNLPSDIWTVKGKNGIHSFTYTDNAIPNYTGYNLLPDTIDHTKSLTLTINVTNSSSTIVYVGDSALGIGKYLTPGSNSITFSSSYFSKFIGVSGYISIVCTENNVQSVYSKPINFRSIYSFQKQIFIK